MNTVSTGNVKASGKFRVVLRDGKNKVSFDSGFQNNLLLDRFFTKPNFSTYCAVGTSSKPPEVTDVDVGAILGGRTARSSTQGESSIAGDAVNGYTVIGSSNVYQFPLGSIVGNISEFVISDGASAGTAIVRNLIKDTDGNPITITVTEDDQLEIWWRLEKKIPGSSEMASITTQAMINDINTAVTVTQINPSIVNANPSIIQTGIGPTIYNAWNIRTVVSQNSATDELHAASAGDDLSPSNYITQEDHKSSLLELTNPEPGVALFTKSVSFGLNSSALETPLQFILVDGKTAYTNNPAPNNQIMTIVSFNPPFTKGKDKILSVAFKYTVSRG